MSVCAKCGREAGLDYCIGPPGSRYNGSPFCAKCADAPSPTVTEEWVWNRPIPHTHEEMVELLIEAGVTVEEGK